MANHVHVSSSKEAWEVALQLLPEGVSQGESAAWGRVYRGTGNRHILDLGVALQVNHGEHGERTTMIWIATRWGE